MSIPNLITLGRILLVPVVVWAITAGEMRIAFVLFLAAGISDAVDGFLAKRFGMATELGAYLDPLADKAMLVSIYVALGVTDAIPALARDPRGFARHHDRECGDPVLGRGQTRAAQTASGLQAQHRRANRARGRRLAALGFDFDASVAMVLLTPLVAALTLLSVAFYVAEWVRHMNAADGAPERLSPQVKVLGKGTTR